LTIRTSLAPAAVGSTSDTASVAAPARSSSCVRTATSVPSRH